MNRVWAFLLIILSISAASAADKDKKEFKVDPASSYANKQTQNKVTIAAVPYVNDDELKATFGKKNPYQYGFVPILVVVQNDSGNALRLNLKAEYVDADGRHIEAIPPSELQYRASSPRRNDTGGPIPLPSGPIGRRSKKNPLSGWEIEGLAFNAHMLPANESVHGFFYFQVRPEPGASLYLTGINEASSGREFFYFEIPLDAGPK